MPARQRPEPRGRSRPVLRSLPIAKLAEAPARLANCATDHLKRAQQSLRLPDGSPSLQATSPFLSYAASADESFQQASLSSAVSIACSSSISVLLVRHPLHQHRRI